MQLIDQKKKVPGAPILKDVAHHCFVRQWLARQLTWQHAEKDEVSRVVDFFVYVALDTSTIKLFTVYTCRAVLEHCAVNARCVAHHFNVKQQN